MISGEQIGELIKDPKAVNKSQLEDIANLLDKHPYCSSLYIIQLIGLSKTSDISFEEKLKVAASHVADREQLHAWIESSPKQQIEETPIVEELAEEIKEEVEEVLAPIEEEVKVEEDINDIIDIVETTKTIKEEEVEEEEEETEVEVESSSLDAEIMSSVVEAALSREIDEKIEEDEIAAAKQKALEKEEKAKQQIEEALALIEKRKSEEAEKAKKKAEKEAKKKEKKAKKKAEKAKKAAEDKKKEVAKKETSKKKEAQIIVDKPANMTFIEWLKYKQQIASGQVVEFGNDDVEETEPPVEVDVVFDLTEEAPVTDKENISKKDINDLLDKFIEGEPKLEPRGKDFYNPTENAKKSVEDSTDLVSETLAEIHVMQGNYEKAISAYKSLTLLYPEKKAIFAARIEKIEEKLNS